LFHNSNIFGSCIIHILYTGCAKIKKKKFRRQKVKNAIPFFFTFEGGIFYKIKFKFYWDLMLMVWWKGTSVLVEHFTSNFYSKDKSFMVEDEGSRFI